MNLIVFLDYGADERKLDYVEIKKSEVKSDIEIKSSSLKFIDSRNKEKYISYHRIVEAVIQISEKERNRLMKKYEGEKHKIYYWKVFHEEATRISPWMTVQNVGDKPHGTEGVVISETGFFITFYNMNFTKKYIIPINRLLGIDGGN